MSQWVIWVSDVDPVVTLVSTADSLLTSAEALLCRISRDIAVLFKYQLVSSSFSSSFVAIKYKIIVPALVFTSKSFSSSFRNTVDSLKF